MKPDEAAMARAAINDWVDTTGADLKEDPEATNAIFFDQEDTRGFGQWGWFDADTHDIHLVAKGTREVRQHVLTHEFGHALGLGHTTDVSAVMATLLWPYLVTKVSAIDVQAYKAIHCQ